MNVAKVFPKRGSIVEGVWKVAAINVRRKDGGVNVMELIKEYQRLKDEGWTDEGGPPVLDIKTMQEPEFSLDEIAKAQELVNKV